MAAQPNFSNRFIRKTQLAANEYHKNFFKLDDGDHRGGDLRGGGHGDAADEQDIPPAGERPAQYWERDGVLRFEAELREEGQVKAWSVLCEALGVASATANKALRWMHEQGIIGYFAGKNGVGIRIFLNRAASIGCARFGGSKNFAVSSCFIRRGSCFTG